MKRYVWIALAAGLLIGADKSKDDTDSAKADELKKFQGKWEGVTREQNGKVVSGAPARGITLTIMEDRIIVIDGKRSLQGNISLDPGKTPKHIDFTGKFGDREIKTLGIYQFDGDKLKVCYVEDGERPTKFSTKDGTEKMPLILMVFKRAKTTTKPKE